MKRLLCLAAMAMSLTPAFAQDNAALAARQAEALRGYAERFSAMESDLEQLKNDNMALHGAWVADGRPVNVHPFGPWQRLHDGGGWQLSCECSGNCAGTHFGVDPDGDVHLCGRSADGRTFRFGNAGTLTATDLDQAIRTSCPAKVSA